VALFIAAGGRLGDGGTLVEPLPAVEAQFGALLDALGGAATLRVDEIEGRIQPLIPAAERRRLAHHARIAVYEGASGEFFALMDCGAWIERYRTLADPESHPNAQIGVMAGNDCRIYQIV
jgi:hypothetical protein